MSDLKYSEILKRKYEIHLNTLSELDSDSPEVATIRALVAEYKKFILKNVDEFDKAVADLAIREVEPIMKVVYFALLLQAETADSYEWVMKFRESEKLRVLMYTPDLEPVDLNVISELANKISQPVKNYPHKQSLDLCIDHFKKWVVGSNEDPSEYEGLKEHLTKIVGSSFSTTLARSPTQMEDYEEGQYLWTLKDWIDKNKNVVLEKAEVLDGDKPIAQYRLSNDARFIIRGTLKKLKNLHQQHCAYGHLGTENILLSEDLQVTLKEVEVKLGSKENIKNDFAKLRDVIGEIIGGITRADSNFPLDLKLFMNSLNKPLTSQNQFLIFHHPCLWSTWEVIKCILLFKMVYSTSTPQVVGKIQEALRDMPTRITNDWMSKIPEKSKYHDLKVERERKYSGEAWEGIMTYMKDAFSHVHRKVANRQQPLSITEKELFALFPEYLSSFVECIWKMGELTEIFAD